MKPDSAAPADPLNLLRQQLILAQVRIMELEDARDELAPRLAGLQQQLGAAQTLADAKFDEAAHLTKTLADLQAQYDHLRHMQHVTTEALAAARSEATALAGREQNLLAEVENLQTLIHQQAATSREQLAKIAALEAGLGAAQAEAASRLQRINQLDAEQRALKASRSWRWTAWLRSLERTFGGKP